MKLRRLVAIVGVLALVTVLGLMAVGTAFAQTTTPGTQATPPAQTTPQTPKAFGLRGFGFGGKSFGSFDAMAQALNLTPVQLFEQLHSGKTISEIAAAQGVDLQKLQDAAKAAEIKAMKDRIAQAVTNGTMTQEQADWLLQGIDKGWAPGGRGFGFGGHGGRGGRGGFGERQAPSTPATPSTTTTSRSIVF